MINQAMILAAGFGKRLHPLTLSTPKPLIDLAGKPLIQHAIDRLLARPTQTIVINTHYLSEKISSYIEQVQANTPSTSLILSHESEILETGGGIANALPYFESQPILCLNSDIWWQDDSGTTLETLEYSWDEASMDVLLALVHRDNALEFDGTGDFFWDPETLTPDFRKDSESAPYIYTGIQILHPRLFDRCPDGAFSIVDLYRQARRTNRLKAIILDGIWSDVGTLSALESLRKRLENV